MTILIHRVLVASAFVTAPAFASEPEGAKVDLLSPNGGLMFWTLIIFVALLVILSRFAFKPLLAAVEAREKSLAETLAAAKAERAAAAALLAEQQAALDAARLEAQQFIVDGRIAGDKLKADLLEQAKKQQAELLEKARRELESEKERAIAELRREAVELAVKGASRVVEQNLDNAANRQLVERFLAGIGDKAR